MKNTTPLFVFMLAAGMVPHLRAETFTKKVELGPIVVIEQRLGPPEYVFESTLVLTATEEEKENLARVLDALMRSASSKSPIFVRDFQRMKHLRNIWKRGK